MSNPTFTQGPITFEAAQALEKFTLVAVDSDGKVAPATAAGPVFGAVTEKADPALTTLPSHIAVHYGVAARDGEGDRVLTVLNGLPASA